MRVAAQAPLLVIFVVLVIVLWAKGFGRHVGIPAPSFVGRFPWVEQNT